jgi:hypothetical protein
MAQGLRGDGESMRKAEEWLTRPPLMKGHYDQLQTAGADPNRKDVAESEQLNKNLSSIPPGRPLPKTSLSNAKEYDYSHLLPKNQRHMKLVVRDHGLAVGPKTDAHPHYTAHVLDDSGDRGSYKYAVKAMVEQFDLAKAFGGLPMPRPRRRVNLHLPVGTWDATTGRIKIRKPDGSEVWHQAKVGLIASSSPATAGADFGNPTSARNPSG